MFDIRALLSRCEGGAERLLQELAGAGEEVEGEEEAVTALQSSLPSLDPALYRTAYRQLHTNALRVGDAATGVFLLFSVLNHRCV